VASRFRSLASVLRALASTSPVPVVATAPKAGDASLDSERVLEILRRGQRRGQARRDRDTPARGLSALPAASPADAGAAGTPGSGARAVGGPGSAGRGEGDASAPVTGRNGS
jgi:hypothetical protein